MTENLQIFRCPVCDTVVEVLEACGMELVCCGPRMVPVHANLSLGGDHEHALVLQKTASGWRVRVGPSAHPMDEDHHIRWIELTAGGQYLRQFLSPGETPEVNFEIQARRVSARCYCSVHGLWRSVAWEGRAVNNPQYRAAPA